MFTSVAPRRGYTVPAPDLSLFEVEDADTKSCSTLLVGLAALCGPYYEYTCVRVLFNQDTCVAYISIEVPTSRTSRDVSLNTRGCLCTEAQWIPQLTNDRMPVD